MKVVLDILMDLCNSLVMYYTLSTSVRSGLNATASRVIGGLISGEQKLEDLDLVKLGTEVFDRGKPLYLKHPRSTNHLNLRSYLEASVMKHRLKT